MKIIISPAKKMNTDTDSFSFIDYPKFLNRTEELLNILKTMSLKLVEEMRKLADYEAFDKDMIKNITQAVLVDNNGNQYPLSEEAISRMQAILNRMSETTGDYKCPFDIDIIFDTKDESIKD